MHCWKKRMVHSGAAGLVSVAPMDRKVKKPLMEKRRRARINQCLSELKSLLLQSSAAAATAMAAADGNGNCSPQQRGKLEKADILEMTVQYLRTLRQQQPRSAPNCAEDLGKRSFVDGYRQCAQSALELLPPAADRAAFANHLWLSLADRLSRPVDSQSQQQHHLTLSIPGSLQPPPQTLSHLTLHTNQHLPDPASLPTPPLVLTVWPSPSLSPGGSSLVSGSSCCHSPSDESSVCGSSSVSSRHDQQHHHRCQSLTPTTPKSAVWRPW